MSINGSRQLSKTEITTSAEETIAWGKELAKELRPGAVVCLFGDLGAGKTTLIKGIVEAVTGNNADSVCSPTFSYLNIYPGPCPVYHFDLYRLQDAEDFISMGFEEYLLGEGICCVEWSERIETILPSHCLKISLEYGGEEERKIHYEVPRRSLSDHGCQCRGSS